jgi:hypothetical protein
MKGLKTYFLFRQKKISFGSHIQGSRGVTYRKSDQNSKTNFSVLAGLIVIRELVVCCGPVRTNLDVINMIILLNKRHSELVGDLCNGFTYR